IYLEKPTHIILNNNKKIESDEEFVKYIYQIKFLQEVGDYTPWEIKERVRIAFIHRDSDEETFLKTRKTENYLFAYVKVAQQAIGRICRTANKNKNVYIFYQKGLEEYVSPISKFFNNKLVNPEFNEFLKSCLQSCTKELQSEDLMKLQRLAKTKDERAQEFKDSIRNPWNLANIDRWEKIRDEVLKKPTINDLSETEFQELYIELPKSDNKFYLYDKYFPHTEKNLPMYSFTPLTGYNRIDAYNVLLPQILQIPGVKDYFKKEGYATYFYKGKYILTSSILTSIYQGALGEVVGRFVLKYKMMDLLDLKFQDLPEQIYEKFDNRIEDIYFDFKNWSGEFNPDYKSEIKNIRRKMKKVEGRKLIVVNILKPNFAVKPYLENFSGAILVLPYLYDIHKKEWNFEGLKKLYEILLTI
ncbi:MAG: hypothetical protein K2K60_03985, partial [Clostridia bacterium]|nr:hypothetical protein [Clostridia bacterium]